MSSELWGILLIRNLFVFILWKKDCQPAENSNSGKSTQTQTQTTQASLDQDWVNLQVDSKSNAKLLKNFSFEWKIQI